MRQARMMMIMIGLHALVGVREQQQKLFAGHADGLGELPQLIWPLCEDGVRRCTRLVHRATVLLRVSTVVAFCAALIGGGAVGAKAEITASVPAGVHW